MEKGAELKSQGAWLKGQGGVSCSPLLLLPRGAEPGGPAHLLGGVAQLLPQLPHQGTAQGSAPRRRQRPLLTVGAGLVWDLGGLEGD